MWRQAMSLLLYASLGLSLDYVQSPAGIQAHQQPIHYEASKSGRTTDLINLHRNLTEIESISGNELEVGRWLEHSLKSQGYHVEMQEAKKNRFNVLAWPGNTRNARLLITSHIDTVPPYIPYGRTENGTISGRGSVDAKASVASMIVAANSLLDSVEITPNDFTLLFVVGEETAGEGMKVANSLGLTPKHVIFGEPTEGKLASGHKGILVFYLRAYGKAAHSGYPWLGRSANQIMIKALAAIIDLEAKLPRSDKYGNTTVNIGRVDGGVAANVVAESATAQVSIRIAAGSQEEIKKLVLGAVNDAVREFKSGTEEIIEIDFRGGYGPVPLNDDVPGFESMVVNYGTDVPNFKQTVEGQKRYLYGPGSIFVAHSDHEALAQQDLENAVKDYKKLILHCLQL